MASTSAPSAGPLTGTEQIQVIQGNAIVLATVAALIAPALTASNASASSIIALTARIAALEGKPSPVVHFATTITPGVLTIGSKIFTVQVKGIVAGDFLAAEPVAALPSGVSIGYVRAPSADTAEIALVAGLAVTMSSAIALSLVALR